MLSGLGGPGFLYFLLAVLTLLWLGILGWLPLIVATA